ncbi:acidic proline-rich protein PRP33-like [Phacochoerus africanus]|uniref:acidic proline-rich protein PRP33-like n=1 Tax=Phacochoerus africanus TaxID=41426 RepID=UPI001FDA7D34|nr:acidic proline-rich protein PRP33-like [Phacochoerus africanus]
MGSLFRYSFPAFSELRERAREGEKKPRGLEYRGPAAASSWQRAPAGNEGRAGGRERGGRRGEGEGRGRGPAAPEAPPHQPPPPARPRSPRPAAPTLSARQEVTGPERAPEAWRSRGRPAPGAAGGAGSRGRAGHLPPRPRRPRPSRKGRRRGEPAAEAERAPCPARRPGTPAREVDAPRERPGAEPGAEVPPPVSFPAYLQRSLCGPSLRLSESSRYSFRWAPCCLSVRHPPRF